MTAKVPDEAVEAAARQWYEAALLPKAWDRLAEEGRIIWRRMARAALAAAEPALTAAARTDERERIATAIEAAYEYWRDIAIPDPDEKPPLHSTHWWVERAYGDAARIARGETP